MEKIVLKNIYGKDVLLEIVDSEEEANFITHSGTFHADEVMATVFLINKFDSIKLFRTNNVSNKNAFVYDVGFGEFDHHAIDFDLKRDNGIKYASCGLIWKEFGKDIIEKLGIKNIDSIFEIVDNNLVMDIDRDDNGQTLLNEPEIKLQNIPNLIGMFNPSWDDLSSETKCFLDAIQFANTIFNNLIEKIVSKEKARDIVEEKINESTDGILILDNYMPWKDIVLTSNNLKAKEILYAVFPSKRGGYNVVATPKEPGSFLLKKEFPKPWAGLENELLQKKSGVDTITFCHKNLFICACKTKEDAIKIARLSNKYSDYSEINEKMSKYLSTSLEEVMANQKYIKEIDAMYYYEKTRGGRSFIINIEGVGLAATSSVSLERHIDEYKNGRRNIELN